MTDKYEAYYRKLAKQFETRLQEQYDLQAEYQQLTQQHSELTNKKNTLLDVLELLSEEPAKPENGVEPEGSTNHEDIRDRDDKPVLEGIVESAPELKEKIQRILDGTTDDDLTVTSLKSWQGLLEYQEDALGHIFKRVITGMKNETKRTRDVSVEGSVKKRKVDV